MADIVVLGAGVSGLTTALLLGKKGHRVTVVAKHMPGDYDIEYASPWAGANFLPVSKPGTALQAYEIETWLEFKRLAETLPEAGIHFQDALMYRRAKDTGTPVGEWFSELVREDAWFKDLMPNFQPLSASELPSGMDGGNRFTSVCINTAIYLPWLLSQCLKHGITVRRGIVDHITDAADLHSCKQRVKIVMNCTGLASGTLGGVRDTDLYPARGQIVVVRNDPGVMVSTSGTDDGPDEAVYIMNRAGGGGCVLGGCLQNDDWNREPDPNLAVRIMKRAVDVCPQLVPPGAGIEALSIVRHAVGLRPARTGGIRCEREVVVRKDGSALNVVHNYGHGGYGYNTSYGVAKEAVELVKQALQYNAKL